MHTKAAPKLNQNPFAGNCDAARAAIDLVIARMNEDEEIYAMRATIGDDALTVVWGFTKGAFQEFEQQAAMAVNIDEELFETGALEQRVAEADIAELEDILFDAAEVITACGCSDCRRAGKYVGELVITAGGDLRQHREEARC